MRNPKHILITGASSGIGAALALLYAAPGVRLALHGRNSNRLSCVAKEAMTRGAAVTIHTGDVTDAGDLAAWIASCDAAMPLDLVIANAGISAGSGGKTESAEQSWKIFAVNLHGVLNTIHPALALMSARTHGQIAIISSLAGFFGTPGAPSYAASKAAVRIYGESLRGEAARKGVEVNVVCPGFIKTPMTDINPFPMPFIISADAAARFIRRGLAANRARVAFPLPMYALVRLMAALPRILVDPFMANMPRKPSFD